MKKTIVIGLTGLSGSGKSTVAEMFRNKGAAVIDCDILARKVTEKGKPCLNDLADEFGGEILQNDGTLDRKKLAATAFQTAESTEKLNKITHLYIMQEIENEIKEYKNSNVSAVLLDAPQLFESGADKLCDVTVCVIAEQNTAKQRIIERDGLDEPSAQTRLDRQFSNDFFKSHTDYVIFNESTLERLKAQVDSVYDDIINKQH